MPSYRRLQQYAVAISIISVVYNGVEGGLSIGFGAESRSRSLIFFGIQSAIEVIASLLVVWRFRKVAQPGEEKASSLSERDLRFEKVGTLGIGILLLALGISTAASSAAILAKHEEPDTSNASLIISASALVIMVLIWLPKRYLAAALDSSTMRGEAVCSLSCVQLTFVLFVGSLVFRVWRGGWWIDGATALVLSVLFSWEGYKMVRWARSSQFTGGCCEDCGPSPGDSKSSGDAELGIPAAGTKGGCCDDCGPKPSTEDSEKSAETASEDKEDGCCSDCASSEKGMEVTSENKCE